MKKQDAASPAVPSALKLRNRELILNCFRDHQEHTVADIVAKTGISKLTVMRAIQFFCAKNMAGMLFPKKCQNPPGEIRTGGFLTGITQLRFPSYHFFAASKSSSIIADEK